MRFNTVPHDFSPDEALAIDRGSISGVEELKGTTEPLAALPAPEQQQQQQLLEPVRPRRRVFLPLLLFAATCVTTTLVNGPLYSATLMAILFAHEMGHFLQALRYHVSASFPYFIPVPFLPFGTMGAVIGMRGLGADRRALFDIGISGPLAGLVLAIPAVIIGLERSEVVVAVNDPRFIYFGEPLLFKWLSYLVLGPIPEGMVLEMGPIAFAGWVGLFITGLNLMPIGQLDGGHVSYALLGRGAYKLAVGLLAAALALMVYFQEYTLSLMLILLMLMGPEHPPTADDTVPLGFWRRLLGWASLASVIVLFTPRPIIL